MLMAYSIVAGELQIGDFTAITVYIMQLFQPLSFLGSIYSVVVQAFVDMRNLMELLEQHPDVQDAPGAPPLSIVRHRAAFADRAARAVPAAYHCAQSDVPRAPAVEFRDVWFRYPSQEDGMGLQGVSFAVPRGSTLGVVGHTGAGACWARVRWPSRADRAGREQARAPSRALCSASTTCRCVRSGSCARLVVPSPCPRLQRGEVLVDGRDVRAVAQRSLRQARPAPPLRRWP